MKIASHPQKLQTFHRKRAPFVKIPLFWTGLKASAASIRSEKGQENGHRCNNWRKLNFFFFFWKWSEQIERDIIAPLFNFGLNKNSVKRKGLLLILETGIKLRNEKIRRLEVDHRSDRYKDRIKILKFEFLKFKFKFFGDFKIPEALTLDTQENFLSVLI